jgi:hypothetical protein
MDSLERFSDDARAFLREFSQARKQVDPRAGSGRADAHWAQGAVALFFAQLADAPWALRAQAQPFAALTLREGGRETRLASTCPLALPADAIGWPDPLSASALACAFLALDPPPSRKSALPAPLACDPMDSAIALCSAQISAAADPSLPLAFALLARPTAAGLPIRCLRFGAPGQPPKLTDATLSAPGDFLSPEALRERFGRWIDQLPGDLELFAAAAQLARATRERQARFAPPAAAGSVPAVAPDPMSAIERGSP